MTFSTRTRRRSRRGLGRELAGPLFRWGFTLICLLAITHHQTGPALVTGGLAWSGWHLHRLSYRRRR